MELGRSYPVYFKTKGKGCTVCFRWSGEGATFITQLWCSEIPHTSRRRAWGVL